MTVKIDRLTRFCFLTTLLLMALASARSVVQPAPSVRAESAPEYATEIIDKGFGGDSEKAVQQAINERAHNGWQLVTATVYDRHYSDKVAGPVYVLVFRK